MSEIWDLSNTDANNDDASFGFQENINPSAVNDNLRRILGALSRWYNDTNGTLVSAGSGSAYTLASPNRSLTTSYSDGLVMMFQAHTLCSNAATLAVGGKTAKTIYKQAGVTVSSSDIIQDQIVLVAYETGIDAWQMLSPVSGSGTAAAVGAKGADIASATTLVIGTDGDHFDITGTTTITGMTVAAGRRFTLQFDAVLTLTHGASLVLPTAANIATAAGDIAVFQAVAADSVRCISYTRANGKALDGVAASDANDFTGNQTFSASIDFPASELTIATGAVTVAKTQHTIDTEGDAASDDLDTLTASGVQDGAIVILRPENAARVVTVKHATGNIDLAGNADFVMNDAQASILLQYDLTATTWYEICRTPAASSGQILQYAYTEDLTRGISTTSTGATSTGVSIALGSTLASASAKVRIRVHTTVGSDANRRARFTLHDGSGLLTPTGMNAIGGSYIVNAGTFDSVSLEFVDTVSSTTPKTYTLYWFTNAGTLYLGEDSSGNYDMPIVMTAEELAV